jgi:drug/metabolite transporter (DMT)-like permease
VIENIPFLITYRSFFTTSILFVSLLLLSIKVNYSFERYVYLTLGSLSGLLGLICMLTVVRHVSLRWVGIYNLAGVILVAFYLSAFEGISLIRYGIGVVFILIGFIWFLSTLENSSERLTFKDHVFLFLMMLFFKFGSVMHWRNLTLDIHPLLVSFNQELVVFVGGFCWIIFSKQCRPSIIKLGMRFLIVFKMASVALLALILSFYGLRVTDPFLSGLLFLLSPISTIFLGVVYFKERLSWSTVASTAIISLGSFLVYITIN